MSTKTTASTGTQRKTKKRAAKTSLTSATPVANDKFTSLKFEDDGEHIGVQAKVSSWGSWAMSPHDALAINYVDHEL